jgi:single-stranded-DNA-specific exonuclease
LRPKERLAVITRPVIRRRECADPGSWPDGFPPLLRRIHAARGSNCIGHAQPRLAQLHPPDALTGIDAAARLLAGAIAQERHILIVGDFDCDGATACAVGVRGLRMLGATRVSHAVPNRMVHGYGLSPQLVDELAALQPDLLVTVDHGIACHAGIATAKARGWDVLVTDHHLPGDTLPPADVIVNPNLRGDAFPSKALAGVGVMFYVLLALRRWLRAEGAGRHDADLTTLLDLVAVGTVADLVPLDANNRALVAAGLRRLRAGQGCAGLHALAEIAGCRTEGLCSTEIAFRIAPRINAAGRLEDMALGIECLLADDATRARELAEVLHGINAERQGLQREMVEDAEAMLPSFDPDVPLPAALCVHDGRWHPGVVGLVASKLKERTHRPVIAFAPGEPGSDSLRGSARSVPGLHVRDALAAIDCAQPGLIGKFGGHAMAAGLSLPLASLQAFREAWLAQVEAMLDPALLQAELWSDGELAAHEFDRTHAELLRHGGPWGQGYPEPLFDGEFDVAATRIVGERHLRFALIQGAVRVDAIHFGGADEPATPRVRIAYRLVPDDFRGGAAVQLVVVHREAA